MRGVAVAAPSNPDELETQPMMEIPLVSPSPLKIQSFDESDDRRRKFQRVRCKTETMEFGQSPDEAVEPTSSTSAEPSQSETPPVEAQLSILCGIF